MAETVFLGLSGGVDSSVSALRLKEQGFDVVAVYMKNWSRDLPGFTCPWQEDYQDAKRVAVKLGLKFQMFDFETEYQKLVVDYMLDEYQRGNTPNPDIMCNQEIKFRLFKDAAFSVGATKIATGHYAKTHDGRLFQATDQNKDQTYFLYRVTSDALKDTIFPIGDLAKQHVRRIAEVNDMVTAKKPESMGICFVGNVGIKDFLKQFISTEPGPIVDQHGITVGQHDGALFYTIGQRHGLNAGGGLPYYVTGKDISSNTVYVTTQLDDEALWSQVIRLRDPHWIRPPHTGEELSIRTRHLGSLVAIERIETQEDSMVVYSKEPIRAVTPGQSVVVYAGHECLGGGIVTR